MVGILLGQNADASGVKRSMYFARNVDRRHDIVCGSAQTNKFPLRLGNIVDGQFSTRALYFIMIHVNTASVCTNANSIKLHINTGRVRINLLAGMRDSHPSYKGRVIDKTNKTRNKRGRPKISKAVALARESISSFHG